MSELYLVNHRPPKHEPFKNIMRLSKDEAFERAAKLFADNDCKASERFGSSQFPDYYATRIKAEKWLYDNFIKHGGKPKTAHPLYFYVHDWDLATYFWTGGVVEKISLTDIDLCDISFTFGDSCGAVDNPELHYFFMKDELIELVATHGCIENLLDYVKQEIGYGMIEAHLWNDKYVLMGGLTS